MAKNPPLKRPYLLVLTTTFPRWCGDTLPPFVFELCRRLTAQFRVVVLAPHVSGSQRCERMSGVLVIRFRYAPDAWETLAYSGITARLNKRRSAWLLVPALLVAFAYALCVLLRRRPFAAIHAHWLLPLGLLAVLSRVPTLATAHGTDVFALRGQLADALRRYVVRRAAAITTVSEALRQRLVATGALAERITVQPMGIEACHLFTPGFRRNTHFPHLLFVGRLVETKGLLVLLTALTAVLEHHPKVSLEIIGDGLERDALITQTKALGLTDYIHFVGALPNTALPEFYRNADLAIFPSLIEGFGLVLTEAMACGCPVVASDLPPFRELAEGCPSVAFFPPGDSAELVAAILEVLANPAAWREATEVSRRFILERYDWEPVSQGYSALLQQVMKHVTD